MRSHFQFPQTYISKLASKAKKNGKYTWNKPISRHLPNGKVVSEGEELLMLAGYSYLGYISDKKVSDSALHAIDTYGLGTHGTRPNCGTTEIHLELESLLCQVTRSSSATLFPSGFQANISTIAALVGKNDIIMGDELNHASIVDGCKLSPAEFRAFKHNSLDDLKRILKESGSFDNRLIIVDSIFSMDGDMAPVPELCLSLIHI